MMLVGLIGFLCYRLCVELPTSRTRAGLVLRLTSAVALAVVVKPVDTIPIFQPFVPILADLQALLHYLLLAANILGFHLASDRFATLARQLARLIGWSTGATFSIYLFHMSMDYLRCDDLALASRILANPYAGLHRCSRCYLAACPGNRAAQGSLARRLCGAATALRGIVRHV